jgi:hypothetical protein
MSPIHFDRVQPGQLIRSQFLNTLIDEIEYLHTQLEGLTGGNPDAPVITALIPGGDVAVGTQLQILGRNFAEPAYLNSVTLDDLVLTGFLPDSNDTSIRIGIPGGVPGLPRTMTLTVRTSKGQAHTSVRIVPAIPDLGGPLVITNETTGQQPMKAGQTTVLSLGLSGEALSRPEQFRLSAVYTNADPVGTEGAWLSATSLVGVDVSSQITVGPGDRPVVNARVLVPSGATAVDFSLRTESLHNSPASDAQSLPLRLVVGRPPPSNDAGVQMHLGQHSGANAKVGLIDGVTGLLIRYNSTPVVRIEADFTAAGRYEFSGEIANAGTLWNLGSPSPPTFDADASSTTTVTFQLGLSATGPQNEKRALVVTAEVQDPGGSTRSSSITVPVVGFA